MKNRLNEENKQALVVYQLQRAKATLQEADILIKDGFYNAAVNRMYYACYYAVIALLIKNDIIAHTHHGVKQMFALHFVTNGKIDKHCVQFYSQLFNDRISGDYDDFLSYDCEKITFMRPQAEDFINNIGRILEI